MKPFLGNCLKKSFPPSIYLSFHPPNLSYSPSSCTLQKFVRLLSVRQQKLAAHIYTTCILFQEKTICNKSNGNHYILQLTWNNHETNALYFNYRRDLLGPPSSPSILSLGRRDHFEERITLDRREIVIFSTDRGSGHLCSGREGILADNIALDLKNTINALDLW